MIQNTGRFRYIFWGVLLLNITIAFATSFNSDTREAMTSGYDTDFNINSIHIKVNNLRYSEEKKIIQFDMTYTLPDQKINMKLMDNATFEIIDRQGNKLKYETSVQLKEKLNADKEKYKYIVQTYTLKGYDFKESQNYKIVFKKYRKYFDVEKQKDAKEVTQEYYVFLDYLQAKEFTYKQISDEEKKKNKAEVNTFLKERNKKYEKVEETDYKPLGIESLSTPTDETKEEEATDIAKEEEATDETKEEATDVAKEEEATDETKEEATDVAKEEEATDETKEEEADISEEDKNANIETQIQKINNDIKMLEDYNEKLKNSLSKQELTDEQKAKNKEVIENNEKFIEENKKQLEELKKLE